jgi:hypothetical protein
MPLARQTVGNVLQQEEDCAGKQFAMWQATIIWIQQLTDNKPWKYTAVFLVVLRVLHSNQTSVSCKGLQLMWATAFEKEI